MNQAVVVVMSIQRRKMSILLFSSCVSGKAKKWDTITSWWACIMLCLCVDWRRMNRKESEVKTTLGWEPARERKHKDKWLLGATSSLYQRSCSRWWWWWKCNRFNCTLITATVRTVQEEKEQPGYRTVTAKQLYTFYQMHLLHCPKRADIEQDILGALW